MPGPCACRSDASYTQAHCSAERIRPSLAYAGKHRACGPLTNAANSSELLALRKGHAGNKILDRSAAAEFPVETADLKHSQKVPSSAATVSMAMAEFSRAYCALWSEPWRLTSGLANTSGYFDRYGARSILRARAYFRNMFISKLITGRLSAPNPLHLLPVSMSTTARMHATDMPNPAATSS